MNQPFKTYNGGKGADGTYQKIISIMPPHHVYAELFLGNGNIFKHKKPAQYSILNDVDGDIIKAWIHENDCSSVIESNCQKIFIQSTDAISWLQNFRVPAAILKLSGVEVMIYLDPPYPMETRKSTKARYNFEMSDFQHFNLLQAIQDFPSKIVISSYPNELYQNALANWETFTFSSQTRGGS